MIVRLNICTHEFHIRIRHLKIVSANHVELKGRLNAYT